MIWDPQRRELVAVRDHFGIKLLFLVLDCFGITAQQE